MWDERYKSMKPCFVQPYIHSTEVAAIVNAAQFLSETTLELLAEVPLSLFSSAMYV
jgi:hypothetical protein